MADSTEKHGKTLFVRNLPYSATNDSLEKIFSDVGPLKSCFVVKDKDSGKCRGFGYVKFTILEDAEKALSSVKKVDGRPVQIIYANKKEKKKRFGLPNKQGDEGQESLEEKAQSEGNISVRTDGGGDGAAEKQDGEEVTQNEKKKKNKKKAGLPTPVKGEKQAPNPLNEGKRARLIVRNLAFRCTKEELQKAFEKCGTVVDVHIPKKATGTRLGFGFIQYENKAQAGMAVAQLNGISVAGRQVAVDWALPKNLYESRLPAKPVEEPPSLEIKEEPVEIKEEPIEDMEVDDDVDDDEEEEEEAEKSSEEEDEKDEDEESLGEEDEDDDSEDDTSEPDEATKKKPPLADRPSDVGEGRTIFMRNLPFSTNEEEIMECFSEFGEVKYARIVKDFRSGMSKGSAFVQFLSKEGASASLEAAADESSGGISMAGRQLMVSMAVSREQAGVLTTQMEEEKKRSGATDKKEEKDTRNLYLAREGMIRAGTEAAKEVPAGDLALRTKIAEANRLKLRDQNVFVSSTRLCVHNIPPTIEEPKLKQILVRAAADKEAHVTECRIMRDLARVNSAGQGKSKGFAFVSFTQHIHALAALKKLNNCPNTFGDYKRPIVEFSLENRKALETKQKRLEKSRIKTKSLPNGNGNSQRQAAGGDGQGQTNTKRKWKSKPPGMLKQETLPLVAKKQQDKVARSMYEGPLGLPSHSGPKQRHKPRPQQQQAGKKGKPNTLSKGNSRGLKQPQKREREQVKPMKPNKKRKDVDGFDKLVASYKQKIMASVKF